MINVEIKARCDQDRQEAIRQQLISDGARHPGTDHQIDTYFRVSFGRLKLREGNFENAVIQYDRLDSAQPKVSRCTVVSVLPGSNLKEALMQALGVLAVVDKTRNIFWLDNVKIHLDRVERLGHFIEIEAQELEGTRSEECLRRQCEVLMQRFGIQAEDLIETSYSDLLLAKEGTRTKPGPK